MKQWKTGLILIVNAIFWFTIQTLSGSVHAEEKKITDGKCESLALSDIPVGNFTAPRQMPQSPLYIEQKYNNSKKEGYTYKKVRYYGHDGLDTEGESETKGVNDVRSIMDGVAILSKSRQKAMGWGESTIIATRANKYSAQIITTHYHHMHSTGEGKNYITTRRFNACDTVGRFEIIGKEGSTGKSTGSHLHFGVRRWKNLKELKKAIKSEGKALFGSGYVFSQTEKLKKHLDPQGLLFDTFLDYQEVDGNQPPYAWSYQYVLGMRDHGIEFGLYDGRYGAQEPVTRREAARWIKIAAERTGFNPGESTFIDVPTDDPDYTYIETLLRYPSNLTTLNPNATCKTGGKFFCPDNGVNRAEALKMVVRAFFGKEYLWTYKSEVWENVFNAAIALLSQFLDVDPVNWYASYVYFGAEMGLVANNDYFNPADSITREEIAKWIMLGYKHKKQAEDFGICAYAGCPLNYFCDQVTGECHQIPICVPSETMECEVGGGYQEQEYDPCNDNPDCQTGQTKQQACGNGGTQTAACTSECAWGAWGICENSGPCSPGQQQPCGDCGIMTCGSNNQWGPCQNQGVCSPGQTQQQTCNSVGTQTKTCSTNCTWSGWSSCSAVCPPGLTQYQSCTVNGQQGTKEKTCNGTGQWGNWGSCIANCSDVYITSSGSACFNNPQGAGTPTLCLQIQQNNGANWEYKICKQGGQFQNGFTYQLKDENHSVNFTQYSIASGVTCTPWKSFSVGYIPGYGVVNGAGVVGNVTSPQGCNQSSCKYKTGSLTIRKECQ